MENMTITEDLYAYSLKNSEKFWAEQAQKYISWFSPWEQVLTGNFENLDIKWFTQGTLNACYNCVDRHLAKRGNQIALIFENNDGTETKTYSYHELHKEVCRFANVLKKLGVKKGDRVCIYMPMIPEAFIAMLATVRIGAIHTVVFAGFSSEALANRIDNAGCELVITANVGLRGDKIIPLKQNVDHALQQCRAVKNVLVIQHTSEKPEWIESRDHWYHILAANVSTECPCIEMDANDPLFILYTSGSTGQPKGILHGTGGYLVYTACTFSHVFNYQNGDVYWCTADIGWITGHSYGVYGPLCNAATVLVYEGILTYPTPARAWQLIDKHNVNIFYTAPTAIRMLRQLGNQWVQQYSTRKSLKLLGTVGEPINPEVWEWYYQVVGEERCPIVDTWWQTETGGIMITPLPNTTPLKPGSAAHPFFGIDPAVVDDQGNLMPINKMGHLIIKKPWPGMMQTIYGDTDRFRKNYFGVFPHVYFTGDEAKVDEDHYLWISGRGDDVLKISGHRLGTGEIENAFLQHPDVAEAAVVGVPHAIKGEAIYAFVTLKNAVEANEQVKTEMRQTVREVIGAIATPEFIQCCKSLPKTRSGKIMRRLLRKIANRDIDNLGDVSTLAEPEVLEELLRGQEEQSI